MRLFILFSISTHMNTYVLNTKKPTHRNARATLIFGLYKSLLKEHFTYAFIVAFCYI